MNIRTAEAGRGTGWLLEGFGYFTKDAGIWIATTIILFVASLIIAFIPLGNIAAQILWYIVLGGLMIGLRDQDAGESFRLGHIVAGFEAAGGQLALLGVFAMIATIVIVLATVALLFMFVGAQAITEMQGDPANVQNISAFLLPVLIAAGLTVPLIMALWFAPALIVLGGKSAMEAMSLSFKGCLRNVVPFLLYGILGLVLAIVASIPLFLGWLVLFPMVTASVYIAYKDIFEQEAPGAS